jgi:hypothetical protein
MATKTPEMVAEVTNKSDLLARLRAYEAQQAIMKEEEFATIDLTLGTPIPDTPIPSSPRAFDFPEDYLASEEEDVPGSK